MVGQIFNLVPRTGIGPVRVISPQDFKSCASTSFATWAEQSGVSYGTRTHGPVIKSHVLYQLS